jgi:hypothetical protein
MAPGTELGAVAPHGYAQRRGEVGEFNAARTGEFGAPGAQNQTMIMLKNGQRLTVNQNVAGRFQGFLNEMIDRGYPVNLAGGGGGYVMRGNRSNPNALSMHAYGTAADINVGQNPFHGGTTNMQENRVEQLAWRHGLSWGGRFGDPMHFEAMGRGAWASKLRQLGVGPSIATASAAGNPIMAMATPEQMATAKRRLGFIYDPDTGAPLRSFDPYTGSRLGGGEGGAPGSVAGGVAPGIAAARQAREAADHQDNLNHIRQLRHEISQTQIDEMGRQRSHGEGAPLGGARDPRPRFPHTPGVGTEAAPLGGAREPAEVRRRRAAWRGRVMPRTPGVGHEAAPLGGAPEPADSRQRRMDEKFRELHEREEQEREQKSRESEEETNRIIRDRNSDLSRLVGRADETPAEAEERRQRRQEQLEENRKQREAGKRIGRGRDLDSDSNVTVTGKGRLDVNVNAPPGTRVSGGGDGLLKVTKIQHQVQMTPAEKTRAADLGD